LSTGFIYIVNTVTKDYSQKGFSNVPTQYDDRLYFGPCKVSMRPKVNRGDYVFGVSPAKTHPRRIVFIFHVEECITFGEAYKRFSDLRGPAGPIHVKPKKGEGSYPYSSYEHIPGSMHRKSWESDLAPRERDAFLVSSPRSGDLGCWLGEFGPVVDGEILAFFKTCSVHGFTGHLSDNNTGGSKRNPIAYGGLYTGLHLETNKPEALVSLCEAQMVGKNLNLVRVPVPEHRALQRSRCGNRKPRRNCR